MSLVIVVMYLVQSGNGFGCCDQTNVRLSCAMNERNTVTADEYQCSTRDIDMITQVLKLIIDDLVLYVD
jgi:hypothetical protein